MPDSSIIITCDATDADNDILTYNWSISDGTIIGSNSTVTYIAPTTEGTYNLICTVSDGNDGEDTAKVNIFVSCGVTDIDGNFYWTVLIGDQLWMAENLKVTHYGNGDEILYVTNNDDWLDTLYGTYCYYNNDINNKDIYGNLYNWYAIDDERGLAPSRWRVATNDDWWILIDYLGGSSVAGGKMKETGIVHWDSPNTGATNESGFTALPAGYRYYVDGDSYDIGTSSFFWSSTESDSWNAAGRRLYAGSTNINYFRGLPKIYGFPVRCVRAWPLQLCE